MKSVEIGIFSVAKKGKYGPRKTPYLDFFHAVLQMDEVLTDISKTNKMHSIYLTAVLQMDEVLTDISKTNKFIQYT